MLTVVCIKEVKDSTGSVIGYTLQDSNKQQMTVKKAALIEAMLNNKISVTNIKMNENHELSMVSQNKEQTNVVDSSKDNRMKQLVEQLNKAALVYEQGQDEIMSNFEYDKLYDELLGLEKELGYTLENSPTQNVGSEVVSKLEKYKHNTPMLSLDKTKDRKSLVDWLNGHTGVLSWKMDGLTVVLEYNNGKLERAVTRGNGEIGEIVTANAKQFKNVPRNISFKGKLVLRGEAVITYSDFEKINNTITNSDEKFKNPRNLCSGSVRQLDSAITKSRNVKWYAFEIVEAQGVNLSNQTSAQFKQLTMLGFEVVEHKVVEPGTLLNSIEEFSQKIKSMDIPTDGLVLTFEDKEYGRSLGKTSKFPRHSIAFKWADTEEISRITGVEWSPSRTGLINPVALFEPVDIEGSTVARASVHNVSIFFGLELGIGDRVKVYKANMIIPQISENLDRTGTCEVPGECPCCGEETEIRQDPKSGVYTLWCTNPYCDAKGNKSFEHFVKRDCMNIEGVSESTLVTLMEEGIITDFVSIYHIKEHKDRICRLSGFGEVSFDNIVRAVDKSRNVKLHNLIYALGIPNVGLATAKLICKHFNNDLADTVSATYEELVGIEGVGDVIANSFYDYFNIEENAKQFVRLTQELNIIKETASTNNSMAGVTICVTGDVYRFSSRRVVKDVVESLGGKLTSAVSRSTTYLVTNDKSSGSNKNKAAQQYGISILNEEEFIDKFNLISYVR